MLVFFRMGCDTDIPPPVGCPAKEEPRGNTGRLGSRPTEESKTSLIWFQP